MAYAPGTSPIVRPRSRRISRPVKPSEGPWLIWSHYHGMWHRPNAQGYTANLLEAGIFSLKMAKGYHDVGNYPVRDEAIPLAKARAQLKLLAEDHYRKMQVAFEMIERINTYEPGSKSSLHPQPGCRLSSQGRSNG